MDRGAWWATVHRIAKSQKRLKQWACKHAKRSLVFWSPNPLTPGRFQGFKGPLEFPRWLKHLWYSWCASGPHLIAYTNQMIQCGQGHINSLRIRMAKTERQPRLEGWSSEPGDISLTSSREGARDPALPHKPWFKIPGPQSEVSSLCVNNSVCCHLTNARRVTCPWAHSTLTFGTPRSKSVLCISSFGGL